MFAFFTIDYREDRYDFGVVSKLQRLNQNSEGAVVLMRAKVTINKNSNTSIVTLELRRKTKR